MRWAIGIGLSLLCVVVVNVYMAIKAIELQHADPVVDSYALEAR